MNHLHQVVLPADELPTVDRGEPLGPIDRQRPIDPFDRAQRPPVHDRRILPLQRTRAERY